MGQIDPFAKYGGTEVKTTMPKGDPFAKYGGSEVKKNPSPPVSEPTSPSFLGGLDNSQNSQPLTPITDPKLREQVREQTNEPTPYQKTIQVYYDKLSPDEKATMDRINAVGAPKTDNLRVPSQDEITDQHAFDTAGGATLKTLGYLTNKVSKGGLQIVKGGAWALNKLNSRLTGIDTEPLTDQLLDQNKNIDKLTGITLTDEQHIENTRSLGMGALKTGGMLAEIAPAVVSGEFTSAPKAMFALQGFGQGKETMDAVDPDHKINPRIRDGYIALTGAFNAALMGDAAETNFAKMPAALRGKLSNALAMDAIKQNGGEITGELIDNTVKDFAHNFYRLGTDYVQKVAKTGVDLSALQGANALAKYGVNAATGKQVFNNPAGEAAQGISDVVLNQAPLFGAAGVIGDVSKLTPYSNFKNDVFEDIIKDPSQTDAIKEQLTQHGQERGWTKGEIDATNNHLDAIKSATEKLPSTIKPEKKADAVQLVLDRDGLKTQLNNEVSKRSAMDESVNNLPTQHEQWLTDKIDQANDKLRGMATGKKTTYSKGTVEDEGKFFKTTDGAKEEITEPRYNLEKTERNEKYDEQNGEQQSGQESRQNVNEEANGQKNVGQENGNQEVLKPTDNATKNGKIEQSSVSEHQGTDEQQQGVEENRQHQEEPVTEAKAETGGSNSDEQSGKVTSIKNAKIDEDRAKRGLSPLMSETRKDFASVWDRTMKRLDENPNEGTDLVEELHKNPRATTDEENALIIHTLVEAKNDYDKANEAITKAQDAGEDTKPLEAKLDAVSDRLQKIEEVSRKTGSATGSGLNSRKMMVKDDMSLASLETQKRVAVGRKLTTEERVELKKVHDDFAEKEKAYEAKIAELTQRNADLLEKQALDKLKVDAKKESRTKTREQRSENRQQLIEDIRKKLKQARGQAQSSVPLIPELVAIAPELAKLAKSYIADGIDKLDELVDKIHDDLKDTIDGLTKRNVRDALSGYGKKPEKQTKGEIQKKLEDLRTQAKLISKLEDLEAKAYKAKESNKPVVNKEIDNLRRQIRDLQQPETSLNAIKTRIANQIAEYKRRLAENDFSPPNKKPPTLLDPEAVAARGELNRVKRDFEAELEKDKLANRTTGEKILDKALKYRRAELLLNLSGAAKVGMAAMYRITATPLHEIVGSGLRELPLLKQVAKQAPREGHGFNVYAEWKALKSVWSAETLAEVKSKFKGKLDNLDTAFGDKAEHPSGDKVDRLLDLVGSIHAAEKEFSRQNEFRRSVILRTKYAQEHGVDTDNPFVQLSIGKEALDDADRAIFMGKNLANTGFKMLVNYLESAKTLGKTGKISANVLKFLFPIVRVTTNYALEKAQYTPVIGATKALMIMSRGLKNMKPEEADYVMRIMKKQGISAGLTAIGYFNPQAFGGFHIPGQKRDDKDPLKANDISIFGVHIPHFLTHTPLLSALQLGATIRRAVDSHGKTTTGQVALGTASDVVESTPFYETPKEAIKAMESSTSFDQFAGSFLRSLVVPSVVNQIAEYTDKDSDGSTLKRSPKNIGQGIEQGIPGLRQNVPIANPHPGFNEIHTPTQGYKLNNDQLQERQKYYDDFMKSDGAKQMQLTIAKTSNAEQKKKLETKLKSMASKVSKLKILQKYHNAQTGNYDLEKIEE